MPLATPKGTKPKRHRQARKSIKLDRVNPTEFQQMNLIYACEQCSHFSLSEKHCTMGYVAQHTKARQVAIYELTGFMPFCRFQEID